MTNRISSQGQNLLNFTFNFMLLGYVACGKEAVNRKGDYTAEPLNQKKIFSLTILERNRNAGLGGFLGGSCEEQK